MALSAPRRGIYPASQVNGNLVGTRGEGVDEKVEAVQAASRAASEAATPNYTQHQKEGENVKRSKTHTRPAIEFDLRVDDRLPDELGFHCLYRIEAGRGGIVHSPNCPARDMAIAKGQLERVWRGVAPLSQEDLVASYTE